MHCVIGSDLPFENRLVLGGEVASGCHWHNRRRSPSTPSIVHAGAPLESGGFDRLVAASSFVTLREHKTLPPIVGRPARPLRYSKHCFTPTSPPQTLLTDRSPPARSSSRATSSCFAVTKLTTIRKRYTSGGSAPPALPPTSAYDRNKPVTTGKVGPGGLQSLSFLSRPLPPRPGPPLRSPRLPRRRERPRP